VNLQAFPRDFLLKLKPDLEEAESAAIVSSVVGRAPTSKEILTVSPRSTDEPGVVEMSSASGSPPTLRRSTRIAQLHAHRYRTADPPGGAFVVNRFFG
jgi:hypothetical protein